MHGRLNIIQNKQGYVGVKTFIIGIICGILINKFIPIAFGYDNVPNQKDVKTMERHPWTVLYQQQHDKNDDKDS